ncbi:hypothetical protein B9Z55_028614 [Caenorhabditis nigoni]|uniref:Uncharacterized protein n=1 Tax=Caenorhabditis nigoni TaxID=1611254 RepID=A0A2G5SB76_9PELO|nr:hypothetical protein B9Z55_028614 [Caenorhabditis nigoni]
MSRGHGRPTEETALERQMNKLLDDVRTDQQYEHISLVLFTEWVIDFVNERETKNGDWGNEDLFRDYVDDQLVRLNSVTATNTGHIRLYPNEIDFLMTQELLKLDGVAAGDPRWDLYNALMSIRPPRTRQTRRRRTAPNRAANLVVPTPPPAVHGPAVPLVICARPPMPHREAPLLRGMLTQGALAPGTVLAGPAWNQPGPSTPARHPPGTVLVGAPRTSQPGQSTPVRHPPGTVLVGAPWTQPGPSAPVQHPPGTVLVGAPWASQPGPSASPRYAPGTVLVGPPWRCQSGPSATARHAPGTVLAGPAWSSQPGPSAPARHAPGTVLVGAPWACQPGPSAPAQSAPAHRARRLDAVVDRISARRAPAPVPAHVEPEAPAAHPEAILREAAIKEEAPVARPEALFLQASVKQEIPAALPEAHPPQAPIQEEALLLQAPIKEEAPAARPEALLQQVPIKEEEPVALPEALAPEAHMDFPEHPDIDLEHLEPEELAARREDPYPGLPPFDPEEYAALPEDHEAPIVAPEALAPDAPIQEADSIQDARAARGQEKDFSEDSEVFGPMVFQHEDHYRSLGLVLPPYEDSEDEQEEGIQPSDTRSPTPAGPVRGAPIQAPAAPEVPEEPDAPAGPAGPAPAAPATLATPQRKRGRKPRIQAAAPTPATPATPAATTQRLRDRKPKIQTASSTPATPTASPQGKRGRKPKSQTAASSPAASPVKRGRGRPKKEANNEEESEMQDRFVCPGCELPAGLTGDKDSTDYRCGWCLCWYHEEHTTWTEFPKYKGQYWCAKCDELPDDHGSRKLRKRSDTEPARRSAQIRAFDNLSKYSTQRRREQDDDEEEESTPKRRKTTATPKRSPRRQRGQ